MSETYTAIIFDREREILGWTDKETLVLADGGRIVLSQFGNQVLSGRIWRIARLRFECGQWWLDGRLVPPCYFDGQWHTDKRQFPKAPFYLRDGQWWLDEQNPPTSPCIAPDEDRATFEIARITHLETLSGLACVLKGVGSMPGANVFRHEIVAVAFLKDSFFETQQSENPAPFNPAVDDLLASLERMQKQIQELPVEHLRQHAKGYVPHFLTRCDFMLNTKNITVQEENCPEWFTNCASAAKYAKVSEKTIRNWVKRDWLSVEKVGRKIRIARVELDKCIKRQ
jgi:excisionase family DNA binding protein